MDIIKATPQEVAESLKLLEQQAASFSEQQEYDRESIALAQRFSNLTSIALNRARAKGVTPEKKESFKEIAREARATLSVFLNTVILGQLIPAIETAFDSPADEANDPEKIIALISDLSDLWNLFHRVRLSIPSNEIAATIDEFQDRLAALIAERNEREDEVFG